MLGIQVASIYASMGVDTTSFTKGMNGVKQSISSVGSGLISVATGGIGYLVNGLLSAGHTINGFVGDASDLNETIGKTEVSFGASAIGVEKWAETSATAMGQSKSEALAAAATFGNLFTSMKIGQPAAAQMSEGLVSLAGDLASFNNIDPSVALEKLQSGITGQFKPLKDLGVNIDAAAVKAEAMKLGLGGVNGELDASAKAQAIYALLLEQTKNAQGDFARTSDGMANSQRVIDAEWKNITTSLGTAFLPIWQETTHALATFLSDVGPQIQPIIQSIGVSVLSAVKAIKDGDFTTLLNIASGAFSNFSSTMITWASTLYNKLSPYLETLWTNISTWITSGAATKSASILLENTWTFFTGWAQNIWTKVGPLFDSLYSSISTWIKNPKNQAQLLSDVTTTWTHFSLWIDSQWNIINPKLIAFLGKINSWLVANYPQIKPWEDTLNTFVDAASAQWKKKWPEVSAAYQTFSSTVSTETPKIVQSLNNLFGANALTGKDFASGFADSIASILDSMTALVKIFSLLTQQFGLAKQALQSLGSLNFDAYDKINNEMNTNWANIIAALGVKTTGGGLLGMIGVGKRATGGSVSAGQTYMTGERGMELFTPTTNGYIHNASDTANMSQGRTMDINLTVTGDSNLPNDRSKLREIATALAKELGLSGSRVVLAH